MNIYVVQYINSYSGILIFQTSKGNENWFKKWVSWKKPGVKLKTVFDRGLNELYQ